MPNPTPMQTQAELRQFVADAGLVWDGRASVASMRPLTNVSLSFPRLPINRFTEWFGNRLMFWPNGIVKQHRVSVVSSRLGKRMDQKAWWFDGLRTALLRCDAVNHCLCVVESTTADECVARGSELFGIPRLRIHISSEVVDDEDELVAWILRCQSDASAARTIHTLESSVWVSPELPNAKFPLAENSRLADDILTLAGERTIALSCRADGNVAAALTRRLEQRNSSRPIVLMATTENSPPVVEAIVKLGGVPWYLDAEKTETVSSSDTQPATEKPAPKDWKGPLQSPEEWLCHWTRAAYGSWLDQPSEEFLDELILGCETADRSAMAALLRIVAHRRVIASVSTAGESPTVSFTEVPLTEFRSRRIFRRHKQRFDFEPWGIAVRRDVVESLGGAAVEYLEDISAATPAGSLFTQRRFDQQKRIDWSVEREWRLPGDLQLKPLPDDAVCLFVDSVQASRRCCQQTQWRTIVVPK